MDDLLNCAGAIDGAIAREGGLLIEISPKFLRGSVAMWQGAGHSIFRIAL